MPFTTRRRRARKGTRRSLGYLFDLVAGFAHAQCVSMRSQFGSHAGGFAHAQFERWRSPFGSHGGGLRMRGK